MATKKKYKEIKVKKGALHKEMGIPEGEKIGKEKLEEAKENGSSKEKKRANFALNFGYKK